MSSSGSGSFSATSSSENSSSEGEGGLQHASAPGAGPRIASQAQQRGRARQRQIDTVPSRGNDSVSDLQVRIAAIQRQYPAHRQEASAASSEMTVPRTRTSSMAVSVLSHSTAPNSVLSTRSSLNTAPSLTESASTLPSWSSIRTSGTGSHIGQHYALRDDEDGILALPDEEEVEVQLECCFGFLHCPHVFKNLEIWDRHCRAHYRGNLPRAATCPFPRCSWSEQAQRGRDVWQERLDHMGDEHGEMDYEYPRARPSAAMLDHLYRVELITVVQYQELRREGRLSEQPVLNTASRRDDRRRRR